MIREIIFPENVKIISLEEKIGVFEIFLFILAMVIR
jgi:hypothetical protein